MKNKEYIEAVIAGNYPEQNYVPLDMPYVNDTGIIQNLLLDCNISSVAIITSKAGSVRSNHYHKTDWHYLYIVSGSVKYYERDVDQDGSKIEPKLFRAGDMFFSPPMKVHKVEFLEDTVMMSFAKNIRDHKHHEADVVRQEF